MTGNLIKHKVNSFFSELSFIEDKHLYFINKSGSLLNLPSVTSKVESFVIPFDTEEVLPYSAKKQGKTVEILRKEWQHINENACLLGTNTHRFLETYNGLQSPSTPQEEAGLKYLKDLRKENRYKIVKKELRMWHKKYLYAGTCDLCLFDTYSNTFIIDDYKTNSDLFKSYNFLKNPFSYLEDCPYNHYQLQLTYYRLMLEQITKYRVSNTRIIYLENTGEYKIYETYDFSKELENTLN